MVFGTLHLILNGREQMVICSDSRGHSLESGPHAENFQKLFQAGKLTACCTSGVLIVPPGIYASTLLEAICSRLELQDSPEDLLAAIREAMHERITGLYASRNIPDMRSVFSALSVHRATTGHASIMELNFPVTRSWRGRRLGDPTIRTEVDRVESLGYSHSAGDCLPQNLQQRVHPDLPDPLLLPCIDQIFEASRETSSVCRDEIGGPIDVAAIGSNGFRWVRRKPIWVTGPI